MFCTVCFPRCQNDSVCVKDGAHYRYLCRRIQATQNLINLSSKWTTRIQQQKRNDNMKCIDRTKSRTAKKKIKNKNMSETMCSGEVGIHYL